MTHDELLELVRECQENPDMIPVALDRLSDSGDFENVILAEIHDGIKCVKEWRGEQIEGESIVMVEIHEDERGTAIVTGKLQSELRMDISEAWDCPVMGFDWDIVECQEYYCGPNMLPHWMKCRTIDIAKLFDTVWDIDSVVPGTYSYDLRKHNESMGVLTCD